MASFVLVIFSFGKPSAPAPDRKSLTGPNRRNGSVFNIVLRGKVPAEPHGPRSELLCVFPSLPPGANHRTGHGASRCVFFPLSHRERVGVRAAAIHDESRPHALPECCMKVPIHDGPIAREKTGDRATKSANHPQAPVQNNLYFPTRSSSDERGKDTNRAICPLPFGRRTRRRTPRIREESRTSPRRAKAKQTSTGDSDQGLSVLCADVASAA